MPSVLTHAVVGFGLSEVLMGPSASPLLRGLSMVLAAAPDLDVLAFPLGIPYGSFLGHRGFFHSLFCALLSGLAVAWLSAAPFGLPWWWLWGYFFVVIASHGLLDGFTNGGVGIAFFSPFDTHRFFFPWQPIQVSPIGLGFFSRWGMRALASELLWVWLPVAGLVGAVWLARWCRDTPGGRA
jgi:inner membrane protein